LYTWQITDLTEATRVLAQLYERHLAASPNDAYLKEHGAPAFLNNTVQTFRFYESYLPASGRILDWGCRHAPDACLIRLRLGDAVDIDGCDVTHADQHPIFYEFVGLRYERLTHPVVLPYLDDYFDAVVGSGVIEHVPFDYESLKELHRVLKPGGRLIFTFVPNTYSVDEWWRRYRKRQAHLRRYTKSQVRDLLLHTGFRPLVLGFQDRIDLLPLDGGSYRVSGAVIRLVRPVLRTFFLERLTSALCAVAEKVLII
jgi:SAM-dependent methyltransferase